MIRFRYIRWKNFLSTGNAFTEIRLDKNENTLIVGENGAGKSTVLDALCYNLFGKPFRNINLPTLINSINNSDLLTESEFVIGTHIFQVRRGIKPAIFEIYKDGKLVDQPSKIDYQDYLETFILRWNKKTFTQVVVLGNASFTPFMQLKAADRRAIIDDILDIQIFSTMASLLKSRLDANKAALVENKHEQDLTEKEISIKSQHIQQLQKDKKNEIDSVDQKIEEIEKIILGLMAEIDNNNKEIADYQTVVAEKTIVLEKQKKANEYFLGVDKNLAKANSDVVFWGYTETCPTCDQKLDHQLAQKKAFEAREKKKELSDAKAKLQTMLQTTQISLNTIIGYENSINRLNIANAQKNSEIGILNANIVDYRKRKHQLETAQDTLDKTSIELDQLQSKLVELSDKREVLLDEQAHFEVTAEILKDKGIKARIIKQYLPIINKLVNKYLAEQDFFVQFELDENFKEVIKSRHRDEFSYENFSEGEKQKIDMSLMLTWREVAKLKNSAATNILILDEIFDSSLDAQGVEYLMKLLHSLEKCNLFVISHKGDILQDKFKSVIKFEKQGNYSRIV
jgi:DNA repair exonuclease SbcCD ATPase subunit